MKIIDIRQRTSRWHEWRRRGISASNAAIIAGVSPYKTPWRLWCELRGLLPTADISNNPFVKHGNILEPYARAWFEELNSAIALPVCVESLLNPIIRSSLDGLLDDGNILEIKCPAASTFLDVMAHGTVSDAYKVYYPQVQHQLYTTGGRKGYLLFFHTRYTPLVFEIERDEPYIAHLVAKELEFWDWLQAGVEPPKDPSRDSFLPDAETQLFWALQAEKLRLVEKKLTASLNEVELARSERERLRDQLIAKMGDYSLAEADGIRINRFMAKGTIDWKAVVRSLDKQFDESKYESFRKASSVRVNMTVDTDDDVVRLVAMDDVLEAMNSAVWF